MTAATADAPREEPGPEFVQTPGVLDRCGDAVTVDIEAVDKRPSVALNITGTHGLALLSPAAARIVAAALLNAADYHDSRRDA